MAFPIQMNLVDVVIDRADTSSSTGTFYDDDFREPSVPTVREPGVTLQAQVNFSVGSSARRNRSRTGDDPQSRGHIVTTPDLLGAAGLTELLKGDRITSIAGAAFDLEIIEVRPESYLLGGPLLFYADFMDNTKKRGSS